MAAPILEHDWFPAPLPDHVSIGEGSWLYSSYAFIHDRTARQVVVGDRSGIYLGSFFDLGPNGQVEIGDYCAVVGAIFATNGRVVVGDHAFISHDVTIADHEFAVPSPESPFDDEPSVVIGENAWIGVRAVLLGGSRIGRDAVVGAFTVIDGVVPDGAIAAGNPWRVVGSVY